MGQFLGPRGDIDAAILDVIKAAKYGSLMGVGVLFGASAWVLFKNAAAVRGRFVVGNGKAGGSLAVPTESAASNLFVGTPEVRTSYMVYDDAAVGLAGPVTVNVSDVNGTIAQSADTEGGDRTDLSAVPTMNAGLTGDAPVKAVADAVSAFASPAGAADAALKALVKKFGLASATNAVAGAVGSACADGACEVSP